jgi:hypothetical protein
MRNELREMLCPTITLVTQILAPHLLSRFFHGSLLGCGKRKKDPRSLFGLQMVTAPLRYSKSDDFWVAQNGLVKEGWLPLLEDAGDHPESSHFDAVVHFVQASSGTGVHVGGGRVLTCAHVVDARDDDAIAGDDEVPSRIGREKLIMFASGRVFICKCTAVEETADGTVDVAVLVLGAEVHVHSPASERDDARATAALSPPAAMLADVPVSLGARLFCVGNPSSKSFCTLVPLPAPALSLALSHCPCRLTRDLSLSFAYTEI